MFIRPVTRFDKTLFTAPDKSITHRAVMLNAAAEGEASPPPEKQKQKGKGADA